MSGTRRRVRVRAITWLALQVHALELEALDGLPLPEAAPGAHVDLFLTPALARSYSVVRRSRGGRAYELAVARDAHSRGGSRHVHERLRTGDELEISTPRNLFALVEDAPASLLIAGGIGITPLWAMVQRLEALQRPWRLFYAARSRAHAAYLEDIEALAAASSCGTLQTHFDDAAGGRWPDIAGLVAGAPAEAHLYACGPQPMLAAFEAATTTRPAAQVHLERFGPAPVAAGAPAAGGFEVVLARTGSSVQVPADRSILDVLLEQGLFVQYGCMQGACGLCETAVLAGEPDHRDTLLAPEVKAGGRQMLICCSRSRTPSLTLDL